MLRHADYYGGSRRTGRLRLLAIWLVATAVLGMSHMLIAPDWARADTPGVTLELNTLQQEAAACRMSFVMQNQMATDIEKLVFEIVVFDGDKRVARILAIDVGALPKAKTRVRQFDLKDMRCDNVGRVLLNDIKDCAGTGLTAALCLSRTTTLSRLNVSFDL